MKQKLLLILVVVLAGVYLCPLNTKAEEVGNNKKPLIVNPTQLKIKVGESNVFNVKCTVEQNAKVNTECTWNVFPDSLGVFIENEFEATTNGSGYIVAFYKEYSDTCIIDVISDSNSDDNKNNDVNEKDNDNNEKDHGQNKGKYPQITFETDSKLELQIGETTRIIPIYWAEKDSALDVEFDYSVSPVIIGNISSEGVFTATHPGNTKVTVSCNNINAWLHIRVSKDKQNKQEEFPMLTIATKRVNIKMNEFVELMATYDDSTGEYNTVSPKWSVVPEVLGHFVDTLFFADSIGKGYILASYMGMVDSIPLMVQEAKEINNIWSAYRISVNPADTTISIGDTIQYSLMVENKKNGNLVVDSTLLDSIQVEWSLIGNSIGDISEDGVLTASRKGFAVVKAKLNGEKAITTHVIVDSDTTLVDSTGVNSVEIQRVLSNGNILPSKTLNEGESYKISGLPFPLNVLNGALLHFPLGALKEDISIFMLLPEQIQEDSIDIVAVDSVITGVKFVVAIGDSIIEPYYFEKPLVLSLPYKVELLDSLGVNPEEIGLFFSEDGDYTNSGISNVVIDTISNRIIAEVVHFSSLVVRKTNDTFTGKNEFFQQKEKMLVNAPNPFVNQTTIKFKVEGKKDVDLLIYYINGQLVNSYSFYKAEGDFSISWDGTTSRGTIVKPGIYIVQLLEDGKKTGISKMIKLGL